MPDLLKVFELCAKTVRALLTTPPQLTRPFRQPFTPECMRGEKWLADKEAEEEVWAPHEPAVDCCTYHQPAYFDIDVDPVTWWSAEAIRAKARVESPLSATFTDEACTCFWTPEHTWTTHYGAVEPGSQREWNPACPEHGDPCCQRAAALERPCLLHGVRVAAVTSNESQNPFDVDFETPVAMQGAVEDPSPDVPPASGEADSLSHLAQCLRDAVGDHYDFAPAPSDPKQFPFWHDDGLIDAFDWEGATTTFLRDVRATQSPNRCSHCQQEVRQLEDGLWFHPRRNMLRCADIPGYLPTYATPEK